MPRQEFSSELGEMSFHGNKRNYLRTQNFCHWARIVKGIRSFLEHPGFYRRIIKGFSKISRPLCGLLEKDAKFDFDESYRFAFEEIKSILVIAPIMATPYWNKEFEIMCDASDYAKGAVLGQRTEKIFRAIYYARKTFNKAQENYSTLIM